MPKTKTAAKTSTRSSAAKRSNTTTATASAKKATSPKAAAKKKPASRAKAGEQSVTIDRRRKPRREAPPAEQEAAAAPQLERREKVSRRRQIDPTTCERDYSDSEVQFMSALDDYKRKSGRMFPTCSEVLEVIRGLGYVQLSPAELAARGPAEEESGAEAWQDSEDPSVEDEALAGV